MNHRISKDALIIVVSGSRSFSNYSYLKEKMDKYALPYLKTKGLVIYHGACREGADKLVERWCVENLVPFKRFPIAKEDWDKHGKSAGPMRNTEMLKDAGEKARFMAFWDGKSTGTKDIIFKANRRKLKSKVFQIGETDGL